MISYANPFVCKKLIPTSASAIDHFEQERGMDKAAVLQLIRKHNFWVRIEKANTLDELKNALIIALPYLTFSD